MNKTMRNFAVRAGQWGYRLLALSFQQKYSARSRCIPVSADDTNRRLAALIEAEKPCMVSRLGTSEAACVLNHLEICAMKSSSVVDRIRAVFGGAREAWDPKAAALLANNAGLFPPTEECLARFARVFLDDLREMDWIGVWGFVPGESLLIKKYCPSAIPFKPAGVEPYYYMQPWSASLEGLRVLVIHPFAETIRRQFERREKLFENPHVLPDFDLLTIPAVQSLAGNETGFSTWFDALDWMKAEADKVDYDVALIGAGAYGLPLSAHVKRRGKTAVHMGGALQILFGIKGKRWDSMPHIARFYNDAWVRPSDAECLPAAEMVEQGCYW